jgi:hypothetical protein
MLIRCMLYQWNTLCAQMHTHESVGRQHTLNTPPTTASTCSSNYWSLQLRMQLH